MGGAAVEVVEHYEQIARAYLAYMQISLISSKDRWNFCTILTFRSDEYKPIYIENYKANVEDS